MEHSINKNDSNDESLDLKSKIAELSQKINNIERLFSSPSIEFIQEPRAEAIYKFTHEKLIPFIDELELYPNEYAIFKRIKESFEYWLDLNRKPWLLNKIPIAIYGKFSSGKSSLINAILKEELLPIEVTPSTAVATYISYGDQLEIKFTTDEGSLRKVEPDYFKSLKKSFFDHIELAALIKYFVIEYPNEVLFNVSILDTPGYDSGHGEDIKQAVKVAKLCDYVFWVVDINEGQIRRDALEFISSELADKPLYVIVNKADLKPLAKQREDVVKNIEATLKKASIPFEEVLLFSAREKEYLPALDKILSNLQKRDEFDFIEFIKNILTMLKDDIGEQIDELKKTISDLEDEIDSEELELSKITTSISDGTNETIEVINKISNHINTKITNNFWDNTVIGEYGDFLKLYNKFISSFNETTKYVLAIESIFESIKRIGEMKSVEATLSDKLETFKTALKTVKALQTEFKKI